MKDESVFQVELLKRLDPTHWVARGRTLTEIRLGDRLRIRPTASPERAQEVVVVGLRTYGRAVPELTETLTGEVYLESDNHLSIEAPAELVREGP